MYAVGGRDHNGSIINSGEKYDPHTNQWTFIAPMQHARMGFGLVAIDNKIYALGGSNDMSDPMTSVEAYNIFTNKWRSVPDMNLKRAWSSYAVVDKRIYIIGGGILGKLYEAVECYDPRSETWGSIAPLKERRFDSRAVGLHKMLIVFGGMRRLECPSALHTGSGMKFCRTEVYSTNTKQWISLDTPHRPNQGLCTMTESSHLDSAIACGDEAFIIGDMDMGGQFQFVRAYRPLTNTWRGVILNHPPGQRGTSACVLKMPVEFVCRLRNVTSSLIFTRDY